MDPIHSAQSAVLALKEKTHAGIIKNVSPHTDDPKTSL
jgi:hypothetical protein